MNRDIFWNGIETIKNLNMTDKETLTVTTEMFAQLLEAEDIKVYRTKRPVVLVNGDAVMINTRNVGNRESFELYMDSLKNTFGVVLMAAGGFNRFNADKSVRVSMLMARLETITYKEDVVRLTDELGPTNVSEQVDSKKFDHAASILDVAE